MIQRLRLLTAACLVFAGGICLSAQDGPAPAVAFRDAPSSAVQTDPAHEDTRVQYPRFMTNSYVSVGLGRMDYRFSSLQLEPGFTAGSIDTPHLAARVVLFGHEFNRYLAVEGVYLRPGRWLTYRNVNGDQSVHHVWMNVGGIVLRPQLPVGTRVSLYGEAGVGVVSRHGFQIDGTTAVINSVSPSLLVGGGISYHVSQKWDLKTGITVAPSRERDRQPATKMVSTGFQYTMRPIPEARVAANREAGFSFPEHLIQVEYTTNALGYGLNRFFSSRIPIFWNGDTEVGRGFAVDYSQNVFHTRRIFAFDLGANVSSWQSRQLKERFATVSLYPLLRFTLIRTAPADLYLFYSLAGPTFISTTRVDGETIGRGFTFEDFMGAGVFLGPSRKVSAQVKIAHYSNGNFLTDNAAVKVPFTLSLGYAF